MNALAKSNREKCPAKNQEPECNVLFRFEVSRSKRLESINTNTGAR